MSKDQTTDAEDLTPQIVGELYRAVGRWTSDPELLSILGSWRDTLDDSDILLLLKHYNATGSAIEFVEASVDRPPTSKH